MTKESLHSVPEDSLEFVVAVVAVATVAAVLTVATVAAGEQNVRWLGISLRLQEKQSLC